MNLLKEELVTNAKAKEVLSNMGKPDDMKYEQKNAFDNLKKFISINPKKIEALVKELEKNKKLRERQIVGIANTLPEGTDDLRAILQKEYSSFTPEEINLILDLVSKSTKS
jgi:DNA-directed RNA polymerase subunit F